MKTIAMTRVRMLFLLLTLLVGATMIGEVLGEDVPPPDMDAVTADLLGDILRAPSSELVASAVEAQIELRATGRCGLVLGELDARCPNGIMLVTASMTKFWSTCEPAGCARHETNDMTIFGNTAELVVALVEGEAEKAVEGTHGENAWFERHLSARKKTYDRGTKICQDALTSLTKDGDFTAATFMLDLASYEGFVSSTIDQARKARDVFIAEQGLREGMVHAVGFGQLEALSDAVDRGLYGEVDVDQKLLIKALDVLRKTEANQRAKDFVSLQQQLQKQKQATTESAKTKAKMEKDIDFLNEEIDDCASHFYEKVREHDDVAAKLAASEERVKEMEQTVEVSQADLQQVMKKQKETEEILASLYVEREELRQAVDMERALKDAAIVASEEHTMSQKQDQVATAEMVATFKREMEASRHQVEDLQSALVQQGQMTSKVAGQVDKSVVQFNKSLESLIAVEERKPELEQKNEHLRIAVEDFKKIAAGVKEELQRAAELRLLSPNTEQKHGMFCRVFHTLAARYNFVSCAVCPLDNTCDSQNDDDAMAVLSQVKWGTISLDVILLIIACLLALVALPMLSSKGAIRSPGPCSCGRGPFG